MISLNDRIYGLSLWSWILIIIVLCFFFIQMFSSNDTTTIILKNANPENFDNSNTKDTKDSTDTKVYNFNTSWCGWSVRFQPEWTKFQDAVKNDPSLDNVQAFDIKCDDPANEAKCKEFEVQGFPTVIIESNGQRGVYKGPREAKDLIETVKDL